VTGATGFIGRRLCARLLERGDEVTAFVRGTSRADALAASGVRLVRGELVTGEGLREAVDGVQCVLHLAATVKAPSPQRYWRCNAEGTRRLAEVLCDLASPPRLVVCSSLAAAGPSSIARPRGEGEPPAPVSHYGRSKLAGEEAVRELADRLRAVVIRPPIVYGPGDPAFLPSLAPMVRRGMVLKGGLGPKRYSLLHADDLCTALIAATERGATLRRDDPSTGVYSVCDGDEHTWQSICQALATAMGRRPPLIIPAPAPAAWAVAWAGELVGRVRGRTPALNRDKVREMRCAAWTCSLDRAREDLGFAPTLTFEEGLASVFA
jgi:nucleoside-diphosphate-sugar epimerase